MLPAKPDDLGTRKTLSVRLGSVVRSAATINTTRQTSGDRVQPATPLLQNGIVPLKRLTAGRKELKIAHDGATYLLRITKSNKLILTKAEAAPAAITTS